jgi:hypothetical protein
MRYRVLTIVVAVLVPLTAASTQEFVGPSNVLSFQPINAVLEAYSAEYERKVGQAVTVGIGGTYWNPGDGIDELTYSSGDLKLRYYPQERALMGFSFGAMVGYTSVSGTNGTDGSDESASGASFGFLLEHQWLMGSKRNFAVALGVGAKAVMVKEESFSSGDFTARYPTARISVGFAF